MNHMCVPLAVAFLILVLIALAKNWRSDGFLH